MVQAAMFVSLLAAASYVSAESLYLEAEKFDEIRGEVRNFGGVPGVALTAKKPETPQLSAEFTIEKTADTELWLRVYFPWAGQDTLLVTIDDREPREVSAQGEAGRWDKGNIQIWHWVRVDRFRLTAGEHRLKLRPGAGNGPRVDAAVLYDGDSAWQQPWLTGRLSRLYASDAQHVLNADRALLVEAENFGCLDGMIEALRHDFRSVLLDQDQQQAALVVQTPEPVEAEIWVRLCFDGKNIFEGLTMEEAANALFLSIDGELHKTVLCQDGWRWHWVDVGSRPFTAGKHLIAIQKQGVPVRVDKILFHTGGRDPVTRWTRAHYAHPLPFGIPNEVAFDAARRVSDMRAFGSLAQASKLSWLGPEQEGIAFPVRIGLPPTEGRLALEKVRLRPSAAPWSRRSPPQQLSVKVRGDGSKAALKAVYTDRNGERFLCTLAPAIDWQGWRTVSHSIPMRAHSSAGLFYDGTGCLARGPVAPAMLKSPIGSSRNVVQCEGGDGFPDPPFQVRYVLVEKAAGAAADIVIGDPVFESPFDIRAELVERDDSRAGFRITVSSRAETERTALAYLRVTEPGHDLLKEHTRRQAYTEYAIAVPAKSVASFTYRTEVTPGVHRLIFCVGQSATKELLFTRDPASDTRRNELTAKLERRHGAFRFGREDRPLVNGQGQPLPREQVAQNYGRSFRVLADGRDVTSLQYARQMDWTHRLEPMGYDLSDAAGWPKIPVRYGELAIDPALGRLKFSEGNRDRLAVADVAYGGFGAPGHGELLVKGNFVVVPPGEANFTVVDVSDKRKPKVASFVTSWYFSGRMMSYKSYGLYESSQRGPMLLDDLWSNPYRPGNVRSVNLDREKYGRLVHVFEEHDVALTDTGSALWLHDLADVFNPRPIHSIEGATGLLPTPQRGIFFTTKGPAIRALDLSDPRKPRLLPGEIIREKGPPIRRRRRAPKAKEEPTPLVAVGERHFACQLGKSFLLYSYTLDGKLAGRKLEAIGFPKGSKSHVFVAFHKDFLYLVDGQYGPGGYSIAYDGRKSRIFTYRLGVGQAKLVGTFEDPKPTAYSQIAIEGDFAYVNDYNYGLWIFDLSDPAHPQKLSGVATAQEGDGLWLNGRTAYFWQTFGGNVLAIDIRDPQQLRQRGSYWDGGWVACTNRYRGNYLLGGRGGFVYIPRHRYGMVIVDASDPADMKEIGAFRDSDGKPVVGRGAQIYVDGETAYLISVGKLSKLYVFTVRDPAKPECQSVSETPVGSTLFAKGDRLYLAGQTTFAVVDMSDPKAPKTLSVLDLATKTKDVKVIRGIAVAGHCAYLSDHLGGDRSRLHLVDVRDGAEPRWLKTIDPMPELMDAPCSSSWGDLYQDLVVEGGYLFIGNYGQIECFDVSDPENPTYFDRIAIGYQWSVGQRYGEHLFLPGLAGLYSIDVPCSSQVPAGEMTTLIGGHTSKEETK